MNAQTNGRLDAQQTHAPNQGRQDSQGIADLVQLRKTNKWVVGGMLALLVIAAAILIVKRPSSPTATTTPAVTAESLELTDPIGSAIREIQDQEQALTAVRANHILTVAQAAAKSKNTSIDEELKHQLRLKTLQLYSVQAKGGLTGKAEDIATGRALQGDTKAILLAMSGKTPQEDEPIQLGRLATLMEQATRKATRPQQQ